MSETAASQVTGDGGLPAVRSRPRRKRRRERGVALVLVLGALTILTVMLADFQDEASSELGSALSARDSVRAEYAARSAVQLARLLIASEPTIRKGLAPLFFLTGGSPPQIPVWLFADQVLGAFNDQAGMAKFQALAGVQMDKGKKLGIEGASFDVDIIDEDSKINLNSAWRDPLTQMRLASQIMGLISGPQYEPLFTSRDGDGQYSDRMQICGALIDWADANQDLTTCDFRSGVGPSTGPEDSFYQLLDPPYFRKNAPYDSLEELHMVRGVSDDFWANFIDPDPKNPKRRNVTVWGSGKINVNTANPMTLLAFICGAAAPTPKICLDPLEAAKFLSLMNLIGTFTAGAPIFGSPQFFLDTLAQKNFVGVFLQKFGLEPIMFASANEAKKALSTESKVFTFVATGRVKTGQRDARVQIRAVVDFRGAPSPAQLMQNQVAGQLGAQAAGALGQLGLTPPGTMPGATGAPGMGMGMGMGMGLGGDQSGQMNALPYAGFQPGVPPPGMPAGTTPDGNFAFLMPSPGGRIVYFRID